MDYTPNIDAQGMRRPMGPVDGTYSISVRSESVSC